MSALDTQDGYVFDNLTVDLLARQVYVNDSLVHLTRTEFDLLAILLSAPRRVFTRQQLMMQVWGSDGYGLEHSITVHMSNLRRKIGDRDRVPPLIRTLHGVGYRFDGHLKADGQEPRAAGYVAVDGVEIGNASFNDIWDGADFAANGTDGAAQQLVTLEFDSELRLVSVQPHRAFCGWAPEALIGRFYSPDPDIDEASARAIITTLLDAGLTQVVGSTRVRCADGSLVPAEGHTHLHLNDDGAFAGYTTRLILAVTAASAAPVRPSQSTLRGGGELVRNLVVEERRHLTSRPNQPHRIAVDMR